MPTTNSITSEIRRSEIKPGYRVGVDGSIWSAWSSGRYHRITNTWRKLKPSRQSRGHMTIWLGRGDQRFVHRLVLEAFVGPCPDGMECRHLDGNPANNRLDNLAWGTRKENHADSVRHGTARFKLEAARKIQATDAVEILAKVKEGMKRSDLAVSYGIAISSVDAITEGRSWSKVTGLIYKPRKWRR